MVINNFEQDDAFCPNCQEGCSCHVEDDMNICEGCLCDMEERKNECGCEQCTCGGDSIEINIP